MYMQLGMPCDPFEVIHEQDEPVSEIIIQMIFVYLTYTLYERLKFHFCDMILINICKANRGLRRVPPC